jgi:ABC-2 type transport system permease protein
MTDPAGQVVAAGSTGGSIYDLGYRRYLGPRLGRRHAVASLIRHSFRMAYGLGRPTRSKIIPIGLLVLAALPAVIVLGVMAMANQLGLPGGMAAFGDVNPIGYDTYYGVVAQTVTLFVAAQAPELLGRDLRFRVLALYFTRAILRDDYALAKLAALVLAMLVILLGPQALIFAGRSLVSTDIPGSIRADLPSLPPVLAQSLLTAGVLASLGLAVSSFTSRRSFATVGIIGVLIIPPIVVSVAGQIAGDATVGPIALLSLPGVLEGSNAFFFGNGLPQGVGADLPPEAFPLAAAVWFAGATAILLWRYRRVEP